MKAMSLGEAVELFLGEQIASTRKSYQYVLRDLLGHLGPANLLTEIEPAQIIRFGQKVRERPSVKSPVTYNKSVKTVRTFFNWCIKIGYLPPPSPAAGLKYLTSAKGVRREKAMPDDQLKQLMDFAKWDKRAYALVLFLSDTGCRVSGAARLKWSDIDLTARQASTVEKGKPPHMVYFNQECAIAISMWQIHQRGKASKIPEYVFSAKGTFMHPDSLGDYFKRLCSRAQLDKNWGPHSLRHRKGWQGSDQRIAAPIIAEILGNTLEVTLANYFPKDETRVRAAVEELGYKPERPMSTARILKDNKRTG